MATNQIFAPTPELIRDRAVAANTQPGTPVLVGARPAVTITASGGAYRVQTTGLPTNITSLTYLNGGVGNATDHASVAFDGTWNLAVTGATTTTANDVEIFRVTADGTLTVTSGSTTHFGWTDYPVGYAKENGRAAVRIGA
jgi:hypothetical protein